MREKQKARRIYGILETQFRNYFEKAENQKGVTGENLLRLLERRLDNMVFRLGFAGSRVEARQLVRHGHFTVNGKKVNIPSFLTNVGDVIAIAEKSRDNNRIKELVEQAARKTPPAWLESNADQFAGKVVAVPSREEIDVPVEEHLIVELYSR